MMDESSPGDLKSYQTTRDNPIVSEAPRRHVSFFHQYLQFSRRLRINSLILTRLESIHTP